MSGMMNWFRSIKRRRRLALLGALASLLVAGTAAAAIDMFLQVTGIPGESLDKAHANWIHVTAFQLSSSWPVGATEPVIDEIVTTMPIDQSMPPIFKAFANGTVIGKVVFESQVSGTTPQINKRVQLTNARVTSIRHRLNSGDDAAQQLVGWRFTSMQIEDIPATGTSVVGNYP